MHDAMLAGPGRKPRGPVPRGLVIVAPFALTGCLGPNTVDLQPRPVPGGVVAVAEAEDSLTSEWIGMDPSTLAVVSDGDLRIALAARYVEDHFVMLRIEIRNGSDEARTVDPMAITVLDAQRFELPRLRPDEAANRVASLALDDPSFPPRYIITTESNTSVFATSSSARISTDRQTVVERDPVGQVAEDFAQGFTDGFNSAIMRAAERVYLEGFTQAVSVEPRTGRRGRLYFQPPAGGVNRLVVHVGSIGEIELLAPSG